MRTLCRKLHLWLSVPFGIIVTVVCFTGAALVFEQEVMERVRPRLYFVREVKFGTLPVGRIARIVAQELPDSIRVTGVSIPSDPRRTWQVSLSQPRRASVYVDPYTGQITGRNDRAAFFTCMFRMHRWLLDSSKPDGGIFWGKLIVGVSTLLFVFVLLSGVIIWIPKTYRALKNRLMITAGKGWFRFWFDLHVSAGIYAAVLLLIMALTGLTWSFSWYRNGFYKLFGAETTQAPHGAPGAGNRTDRDGRKKVAASRDQNRNTDSDFSYWNDVYEFLAADCPGYSRITVGNGTATVVTKRVGNQRAADTYAFDPYTGTITDVSRYEDSERGVKLRGWIYSLHVGNWGGAVSKILTFLAALIGTSLPLTGYYLWLRRLRRETDKKQ